MLSIDTNILVYSTDKDDLARQAAAIEILTAAARVEAGLTEQSLIEFTHTAMRKAKMPLAEVGVVVREWLNGFALLLPGESIVEDTLAMLAQYRLSVWDARMLAVCATHGCTALLSEDLQDGAVYGGVRVLNPFNPANTRKIAELFQP